MKLKKLISIILTATLSLTAFSACGDNSGKTPEVSDVLASVTASQTTLEDMMDGTDEDIEYLYNLDLTKLDAYAMTYAGNAAVSDEICVVKASSKDYAKTVKEVFEKRIEKRLKDFEGYAPDEEAKLGKATVKTNGNYVILIICSDPSSAEKAFDGNF